MRKQTALYIHDDNPGPLMVPKYLFHRGWNLIKAIYNDNCLEIALDCLPDIIILDFFSASELDLCCQFKAHEKLKSIRLIMITGDIENCKNMASKLGADLYLTKPILRTEYKKIIQPELLS